MSTQPFAICRVAKLKTGSSVRKSAKHTDRKQETLNADSTKTPQNIELIPNPANKELETLVREKIGALTPRKDAVLCSELLLTTSPEYWRPEQPGAAGLYDEAKLQPWVDANMKFVKEKYGKGLVKATLHLDESTPHLVVYLVPLYEKDGQLRLSHKELFGGELKDRRLSQLQDDYALAMHHLGLQRGLKGSKAKHQKVQRVYGVIDEAVALQDQALPEIDPGESAAEYRLRIQPFIEQLAVRRRSHQRSSRRRTVNG